jgi:GTP-binding protein
VKHESPSHVFPQRLEASFAGSAASPAQFPKGRLPEVAFLGRSNVGKSSLLNALSGSHGLARVSKTPGRTRLVNFFQVSVERPGSRKRDELYLVDLPGYGYAKASREVRESFEELALSYLVDRAALRLAVFIVDVRHEPSARDHQLREFLDGNELRWALAANKVDALSRSEARTRIKALEAGIGRTSAGVVPVSAEKGAGLGELWSLIRAVALDSPAPEPEELATRGHDGRN